jgi:hypothetical protein
MAARSFLLALTILLVGSVTGASARTFLRSAHVAYVTKLGTHRWRRIDVLYCLADGQTHFCVGKNGRMYRIVRRTPGMIFLRPVQQ